jgi:hypothetical protein
LCYYCYNYSKEFCNEKIFLWSAIVATAFLFSGCSSYSDGYDDGYYDGMISLFLIDQNGHSASDVEYGLSFPSVSVGMHTEVMAITIKGSGLNF